MTRRLVVIGGGAAGMSAASAARRVDPVLEIVVLEAGGYAAFGVCGLPYFLSGAVGRSEVLLAYEPRFFQEQRQIDLRLHSRVTRLDPGRHVIQYETDGREHRLGYHRLIVAAGAVPDLPDVPGLDDDRVFTVRTMESAIVLRSLLDAGHVGRALVVGADYIGLEIADALVERGVRVTVVEGQPVVMPNLDPPMAALVEEEVRRHGVNLRLGTRLHSVRRTAGGLEVRLDGATVTVEVVIIATGVSPAGSLAAEAGAATGPHGALLVDDHMRTSLPDVLAAGDCVAPTHLVLGRPAYLPLGPAANKTGRVAGTVAAGGDARLAGVVGTAVVKVFDLAVARTGLTLAEASAAGLDALATDTVGSSRAEYYPGAGPVSVRLVHERGGRVLGAQLVGVGEGVAKRVDMVAVALQAGFDIDDLLAVDLSYAPPYAPVYEPVILAAQLAAQAAAMTPQTATVGT